MTDLCILVTGMPIQKVPSGKYKEINIEFKKLRNICMHIDRDKLKKIFEKVKCFIFNIYKC